MWKDLNMLEKSQIIATMVNNGIYNLSDIINEYNNNEHQYRDGGPKKSYQDFRNKLSSYWHRNIDEDDYDYEKYYNDDSDEAYRQLNRILSGSKAHFPDSGKSGIYKKKTHPTYPDLGADSWSDNNTIFHISDRQAYSNAPNGDYANTDRILNYLGSDLSYNNGGTKVMHDNAYVLPEVTVTPNGNYVELVPNIPNTGWVHHDSPFKNPNFNLYGDGRNTKKTAYLGLVECTGEGGTLTNDDLLRAADKYVNFVPVLGTVADYWKLCKNPTWGNAGAFGADIISEIIKFKLLKKAAKYFKKAETTTGADIVKYLRAGKGSTALGVTTPVTNDAVQYYIDK